jgi:uncharacterized protein YbjT (DUF2867 family)
MSARNGSTPTPSPGRSSPAARIPRPALFRRLLGSPGEDSRQTLAGTAAVEAPTLSLEAELADRLDTVLGIAERLAASHDRGTLLRMIVDETCWGLHADNVTIRVLDEPTARGGLGRHR